MLNRYHTRIKLTLQSLLNTQSLLPLITFITFICLNTTDAQQPCLKFIQPSQWTPVTTPICTLSVYACLDVKTIRFKAQYVPHNDSLSRIITIGHLTRRPFKLIWDISDVPNQLTYGLTCLAEAEFIDGKIETLRQEGIFLTHHDIHPPEYKISFSHANKFNTNRQSLTLTSPGLNAKALVNISWNKKALMFHISVSNSLFYTTLPKKKLKKLGTKISIDVHNKRTPYITEDMLIYMIPVINKPYQVIAKSKYNPDGTFDIKETYDTCYFVHEVTAENFKGYTIDFAVPGTVLGNPLPKILGCNIITTVLDESSTIKELSWVKGNHYIIHSPFSYGKLFLMEKPFLANPILLWLISFAGGLILGFLGIALFRLTRKFNTLIRFENAEHEDKLIKNITTIIDAEITNHKFTIADIAKKISLPPQKVNKIIKRYCGKSFKKHLDFSRIEIVKERLRSSNASEISIAKSCGFISVDEMEKIFRAYTGTTPYRYREENRIT